MLREPEGRQSVGKAVGHRLDTSAHFCIDLRWRHSEDACAHRGVQILALREGVDKADVLREVRHDPHFDLAVVGGEQGGVALAHDEALPDASTRLGADRDVLQVGVGARKAPRGRDRLLEGRVDAPIAFGKRNEAVHGLPEPAPVPPPEDALEHRILCLGEERLQSLGVRGVTGLDALGLGEPTLPEENLLELLGRAEVEASPHDPVRLGFGRARLITEFPGQLAEAVHVDRDPYALHAGEDPLQREFDIPEKSTGPARFHLGIQDASQFADGHGLRRKIPVAAVIQGQLTVVTGCDGAAQVALTQAREVARPLPGLDEVGR